MAVKTCCFYMRKLPSSSFTVTSFGIGWINCTEGVTVEWNTWKSASFTPSGMILAEDGVDVSGGDELVVAIDLTGRDLNWIALIPS